MAEKPTVVIDCPRCGKRAFEHTKNGYKCLECQESRGMSWEQALQTFIDNPASLFFKKKD